MNIRACVVALLVALVLAQGALGASSPSALPFFGGTLLAPDPLNTGQTTAAVNFQSGILNALNNSSFSYGPHGLAFPELLLESRNTPGVNVWATQNDDLNGFSTTTYRGVDRNEPLSEQAVVTGSILGNVLTVTGVTFGTVAVNETIYGTNVPQGMYIFSQLSGTTGGAGTYSLTLPTGVSPNVTSETLTLYSPFEHMACGWETVQQLDFCEFSTFDLNGNGNMPPSEFRFFRSGGIDPSGGINLTCSITATVATITCPANSVTNGALVQANPLGYGGAYVAPSLGSSTPSKFPATAVAYNGLANYTTVSSGGGTTSIVLSSAPTITNASVSLNFSHPTFGQRTVMQMTRNGPWTFQKWSGNSMLWLDQYNGWVGIGAIPPTGPQAELDVFGAAIIEQSLTTKNVTAESCYDPAVPTSGTTYTLPAGKCGANFDPAAPLDSLTIKLPLNPITGQMAFFSTTKAISSLSVIPNTGAVTRPNTTPTSLPAGGAFEMIFNANTVWDPKASGLSTQLTGTAIGVTANATLTTLPANATILYAVAHEKAGNAVTIGLGTTSGATDVVTSVAIPANTSVVIPSSSFSPGKQWFSNSATQAIFIDSASWSSASVNITIYYVVGP